MRWRVRLVLPETEMLRCLYFIAQLFIAAAPLSAHAPCYTEVQRIAAPDGAVYELNLPQT